MTDYIRMISIDVVVGFKDIASNTEVAGATGVEPARKSRRTDLPRRNPETTLPPVNSRTLLPLSHAPTDKFPALAASGG